MDYFYIDQIDTSRFKKWKEISIIFRFKKEENHKERKGLFFVYLEDNGQLEINKNYLLFDGSYLEYWKRKQLKDYLEKWVFEIEKEYIEEELKKINEVRFLLLHNKLI